MISPRHCPECGKKMPPPSGKAGCPLKTCGPECRKKRNRARERAAKKPGYRLPWHLASELGVLLASPDTAPYLSEGLNDWARRLLEWERRKTEEG